MPVLSGNVFGRSYFPELSSVTTIYIASSVSSPHEVSCDA